VQQPYQNLAQALREAVTFEDAARGVLRVLSELAGERLGPRVVLRRALLHLRPGGDYRSLVVLDLDGSGGSMAPSASVWRLLEGGAASVPFDVRMGSLEGASASSTEQVSHETVMLMLEREATHVLALPLRDRAGLQGMLSLEVDCPAATGRDGFWGRLDEPLQDLLDLAAPTLLGLPTAQRDGLRDDPLLPVVGKTMAPLVSLLEVFADQDETLLLSGATGTGKSRLANWVHDNSSRRQAPFVHLDLLTVPEDMQMAELFGWKRGAFTGAVGDKKGAVDQARGGTLFIDEIDKLSLKAQAGLLQLLETRRYRVLGDNRGERQADLRFVVGTNAELREAVREGRFRSDLYYRVNVLPVQLPALDERREEIPAWASFMAQRRHAERNAEGSVQLAAAAAAALARRSWPGNLRQLDNVVRRAYAIASAGAGEDLVIGGEHVERALGFELGGAATAGMGASLREAAKAYFEGTRDPDLADADAFRGALLQEAVERFGGVREAYLALGREQTVESRNHSREYRKAQTQLLEVLEKLGETP
jgi:DNA-binding NtrC family response regulator